MQAKNSETLHTVPFWTINLPPIANRLKPTSVRTPLVNVDIHRFQEFDCDTGFPVVRTVVDFHHPRK